MDPQFVSSLPAEEKKVDRNPERRTLAAMACETCRLRKSRCDEQRPKCGLCQKLNKTCVYQEPKPTNSSATIFIILSLGRKDNTLGLILDTLNTLNFKIDRVLQPESPQSVTQSLAGRSNPGVEPRLQLASEIIDPSSGPSSGITESRAYSRWTDNPLSSATSNDTVDAGLGIPSFQVPQRQTTEVHKLLQWPAVQAYLNSEGVDVSKWLGDSKGTESWLMEVTKAFGMSLPLDWPMDIFYAEAGELNLEKGRSITLNKRCVEGLCEIFFQSFHCVYPILDRKLFYLETLPGVLRRSFSEAQEGTPLVLLVLALGSIAQESATGAPLLEFGRDSGMRGGTAERPPGLVFLNEAKRRLGISLTNWNLANLETCILCSVYYSQISRNMEYWRMSLLSCTMCQSLVKSVSQWGTVQSDRISRCYWMCTILEGGLTGELGLDLPGIAALQDSVPLPIFMSDEVTLNEKTEDDLFLECHFLAQITLKSLINRARNSTRETRTLLQERDKWPVAQTAVIQELSTQLENWRLHLPPLISFSEDDLYDGEQLIAEVLTPVDPVAMGRLNMKTVLRATLLTRYKYAQYIIWRPYIYQILHVQIDPSFHSIESSLKALKACTMWPLAFSAFRLQRRLVPHLYEYTHTFFGILILLHTCSLNSILGPLIQNSPVAYEIETSIGLYIDWIRDMKVVHPVAKWAWHLVKVIYKDHVLVQEDQVRDQDLHSGWGPAYS